MIRIGGRLRIVGAAAISTVTISVVAVYTAPPASGGGTDPTDPPAGSLPPVSDVTRPGPFAVTIDQTSGPGNDGWLVHPSNLGQNGLDHPILVWGPGAGSDPAAYEDMLRPMGVARLHRLQRGVVQQRRLYGSTR